jgi:CheY-like chemotaxis protein
MPAQGSWITVVIADDHRSFGEALEVALDKEQDLRVIEVVTDGQSAIDSASKEHPDIVLMDLQMPGVDGIEATRRIHDETAGTAVIILSGQETIALARAIRPGRAATSQTEAVVGLAERSAARIAGPRCAEVSRSSVCAAGARRTEPRTAHRAALPRGSRSCSAWPTATRPNDRHRTRQASTRCARTQNVLTAEVTQARRSWRRSATQGARPASRPRRPAGLLEAGVHTQQG